MDDENNRALVMVTARETLRVMACFYFIFDKTLEEVFFGNVMNISVNWIWNEKGIWQLGWFCQLTATLSDPEYH